MAIERTLTTYLEMFGPPDYPREDELLVRLLPRNAIGEYRRIYDAVGGPHHWTKRLLMNDAELAQLLAEPGVEVWMLEVDGVSAGFTELDLRTDEVEIAYFGLTPEFTGRGLGKRFLRWIVHNVWARRPRRLWLHTCENDHPAALSNYQKAGFEIYDRKIVEEEVPDFD